MQDSVTLSDLPYTGFDYGNVYNSLFWVALLVWSFIIARFIIKHGGTKINKVSAKRKQNKEILRQQELKREPVVLEERVIRYQDPGMPTVSQEQAQVSNSQPITTQVVESVAPAQAVAPIEPEPAVVEQVSSIVDEELAVSRAGQSPDEFSAEDFATTDFDGVNPDVYWQPREIPKETHAVQQQPVPKVTTQESVQQTKIEPVSMPQEQPKVEIKVKEQKQYKDTMTLNKSGEYPHMVIIREEIAS